MAKPIRKIGIMTGGGDCPGLNAVIRAATTNAILNYGLEVVGIKKGYRGLYLGDFMPLTLESVSGILNEGGTILYSSNKDNLFEYPFEEDGKTVYRDVSDVGMKNLEEAGIDALIIIGGDGTLTSGRDYARKGLPVIGVPKTIDNDLASTDKTFGFDTAVSVATEALDRLHTTARSHQRIMCLELMGRYAGWISLEAGIAGAADAILIPEIPYDIDILAKDLEKKLTDDKKYAIVVVAEGAKSVTGEVVVSQVVEDSPDPIRLGGIGAVVAEQLQKRIGKEARSTVLGHVQRGGTPSAYDRLLSTRYGVAAVDLLMEGKYGNMVTLKGTEISYDSLENVIGKNKAVDPNGDVVKAAKRIGISFGD